MKRIAIMMLALAAGGCGRQSPLQPKQGMGQVPKAVAAPRPETPDELMTADTQARPRRDVDLLRRSDPRREDPFDLPPGATNGR